MWECGPTYRPGSDEPRLGEGRIRVAVEALAARDPKAALLDEVLVDVAGVLERLVDPLDCPRCGARMKILAFITDPKVIRLILDHLDQKARPRAPPRGGST